MVRVRMSTLPPPKAAGRSTVKPFWIDSESRIEAGKMSSGMTLRVRSGDGTRAPFTVVLE